MSSVGWDLDQLEDEFIREVVERGVAPDTVRLYRGAVGRVVSFARLRGATCWSGELASEYASQLDDRLREGKICKGHCRFETRVALLMATMAETGEADLSWRQNGIVPKYYVSEEVESIVGEILDAARLCASARSDLEAPVRHLLWFADAKGVRPLEIDDALVMEFLVGEVPKSNSGSTGRTLRAVRIATEWLRANGGKALRDYSMLTLKNAKRRIIPAFSEAEIAKVVGSIDASTARGKRDKAIVLLAYCTGLRACDVLSLRLDEVDWRRQSLTTTQSKTHTPITCVLNGETLNALAGYVLEARPKSDAPELFLTVRAPHRAMKSSGASVLFDKLCEKAGIEKVPGRSFHSLRRSFETVMVSRGVDVETASQMVGHKTVAEDKPYITHDRATTALVALGFGDVPIRHGIYATGGEAT